jgi:hypothetical protein
LAAVYSRHRCRLGYIWLDVRSKATSATHPRQLTLSFFSRFVGGYMSRFFAEVRQSVVGLAKDRRLMVVAVIIALFALSAVPSFAQSTIDFDVDALIDSANGWIDTFLPILSIGFGIAIAVALIERVGGSIIKGIRGSLS